MRTVIAARRSETDGATRYLSKNNLNIARLAALPAPLREGTVVIPFRDPLQQAASMHRQHERFLDIHREDDFVREYMEAIGHHEFGKGLKPGNFNGWREEVSGLAPEGLAFWVRYWTAAYRFVLEHAGEQTHLLSYRRLTECPEAALARLADCLSLSQGLLVSQADQLRPPRSHPVEENDVPSRLQEEASEIFQLLDQKAAI
jgi:hypothetical protein